MLEQTILFIDNISLKRSITGKIIDILLRTDLEVIGMKMIVPGKHLIRDFCTIVKSKLAKYYVRHSYLNKRIMVIALQGENAIEKVKFITGRERRHMKKEYWHGTTIRGMFFGGARREGFFKVYENVVQIAEDKNEAENLIRLVWNKYKENGISLRHLKGYEMEEDEERTFIMVKPYAMEHRLTGKIIDDLSRSGLYIVAAKVIRPHAEQMKQHYAHLKDKGEHIFRDVVNTMMGKEREKPQKDVKLIQLVYQGKKGEVTRVIREIIGSTNPKNAAIGTIRRSYGKTIRTNVVHASALPEDTERELAIWDTPNEIIETGNKPIIFNT